MTRTITPEILFDRFGHGAPPIIIDVCTEEDFASDPRLIPTACRRPHHTPEWSDLPKDAEVVVVCQKGKKLSLGAAALLQDAGYGAVALAGGNAGWDTSGLPRIPVTASPASRRWVTTPNAASDTTLCAWLIRRFIDPGAQLMVVPATELDDVAIHFDARPFANTAGGFETLQAAFGLTMPVFATVAATVRDAHWLFGPAKTSDRFDVNLLNATIPLLDRAYGWAVEQTRGDAA